MQTAGQVFIEWISDTGFQNIIVTYVILPLPPKNPGVQQLCEAGGGACVCVCAQERAKVKASPMCTPPKKATHPPEKKSPAIIYVTPVWGQKEQGVMIIC